LACTGGECLNGAREATEGAEQRPVRRECEEVDSRAQVFVYRGRRKGGSQSTFNGHSVSETAAQDGGSGGLICGEFRPKGVEPIQSLVTCTEGRRKMHPGCEDLHLRPMLLLQLSACWNCFPCDLTHMVNSG
jgi:hypothetical protein